MNPTQAADTATRLSQRWMSPPPIHQDRFGTHNHYSDGRIYLASGLNAIRERVIPGSTLFVALHETAHHLVATRGVEFKTLPRFKKLFGNIDDPYPTELTLLAAHLWPPSDDRAFVRSYSQAHPEEDFADTWALVCHPAWLRQRLMPRGCPLYEKIVYLKMLQQTLYWSC